MGRGGKGGDQFAERYLYESELTEALVELASGAEPPMPDLVPGAVVRGTRMRRRRRAGTAVGAAVLAGVLAVGGHALLAPRPESTPTLPAGESTVRYPSLELLRSILPAGDGAEIEAEEPRQPLRPGRYFRLTAANGSASDLYVGVSRTAVDPSYAPVSRACTDSTRQLLDSPWNDLISRCSLTRHGSGSLLFYYVSDSARPAADHSRAGDSWASGVTYVTSGGWTVQVIAGRLDKAAVGRTVSDPRQALLVRLATSPRIFDAVKDTGG